MTQRPVWLAGNIPGARYAEIPGASHLAPFTHPGAVVDALLQFLTTVRDSLRPGT